MAYEPEGIPLAAGFGETQSAVDTKPGTGIWATATALGRGVRLAAAVTGEAGYFGVIEEAAGPALIGLRIKVQSGAISEAEWIIARKGMALYKPEGFIANLSRATRPPGTKPPASTAAPTNSKRWGCRRNTHQRVPTGAETAG